MKQYKRLSASFNLFVLDDLRNDEIVSQTMNEKLHAFLTLNNIIDYTIINVETNYLPEMYGTSASILVSLHIEYQSRR